MHKITNNTGSPYDLPSKNGNVRLPAFGSVEGEFDGEYLAVLEASLTVSIEAVEEDAKSLSDEYRELTGEEPDKRWGDKRIGAEIDKILEE